MLVVCVPETTPMTDQMALLPRPDRRNLRSAWRRAIFRWRRKAGLMATARGARQCGRRRGGNGVYPRREPMVSGLGGARVRPCEVDAKTGRTVVTQRHRPGAARARLPAGRPRLFRVRTAVGVHTGCSRSRHGLHREYGPLPWPRYAARRSARRGRLWPTRTTKSISPASPRLPARRPAQRRAL